MLIYTNNKIRLIDIIIGLLIYLAIEVGLIAITVVGISDDVLNIKWYAPACGILAVLIFALTPFIVSVLAHLSSKILRRKKDGKNN